MHLGERWFRCSGRRNVIEVGNAVQRMKYVRDGLAYDLLSAEEIAATAPLSKIIPFMFYDWLMRLMRLKANIFRMEISKWIYQMTSWAHQYTIFLVRLVHLSSKSLDEC